VKEKLTGVWFALWVLFAINTMNFFDRQILGAVGEAVRKEWALSDGALGALGTAFTLLYALIGVPLGRLTDRTERRWILSAGVFVWTLMTVASGLAQNFKQLFAVRLMVGVGEASCAPAATSLIGDLVPAERRARALSIFMLGLPVGIALSFAVSGTIARSYGWRATFLVAGLPGVICALAVLFIKESTWRCRSAPGRWAQAQRITLSVSASNADHALADHFRSSPQLQHVRHRGLYYSVSNALSRRRHTQR
jgi:MFS family permease